MLTVPEMLLLKIFGRRDFYRDIEGVFADVLRTC